jgi:RNA polymerase sigma factor (sigma-70 family)
MQLKSDAQLVREYARNGSENAFTEIVNRHTNLVYSCAIRQVGSQDVAAEIAQNVFIGLARGGSALSPQLSENASLAGWLCRATRNLSLNFRRDEFRRQSRERQAMEILNAASEIPLDWERLRHVLDEVMSELSESDYDALVLRFYQNQDLRAVGLALGMSDDTAQKRVARALDKLRDLLSHRGITTTAAALSIVLTANAIQSAPVGLAAVISAAALAGTAITAGITTAVIKTIAMTTLQKVLVTGALIAVGGVAVYQGRQASQLREQVAQQQTDFTGQMAELQSSNAQLTRIVVAQGDKKELSKSRMDELLKLRNQSTQAKSSMQELASLKASTAQGGAMSAAMTNAMAQGLATSEKFMKKAAMEKLARMKAKLGLTDDQEQAISDIMMKRIADQSQMTMDAMMGKTTLAAIAQSVSNEDRDIEAQLTPGQLAAYPDFEKSEGEVTADKAASAEVSMMTMSGDITLTPDQQDKIHAAFYQVNLNHTSADKLKQTLAAGGSSGNGADAAIEMQKQMFADKMQAVSGILTPDQLKTYQQQQSDFLDATANAMKIFPHVNQGTAK